MIIPCIITFDRRLTHCFLDVLSVEFNMKAVIQRVSKSSVTVDNQVTGSIGKGILVLLGVAKGDTEADAKYLVEKITGLRIFPDDAGKMNLDLSQAGGALLVVSQFTLLGDCRKGR